jgi:hypothetical protein
MMINWVWMIEFASSAGLKSPRQALFSGFSHEAMKVLNSLPTKDRPRPAILLTGGLRSPALLRSVVQHEDADLLGIGRMSILCPNLPSLPLDPNDGEPFVQEPHFQKSRWLPRIPLLGSGVEMAWYNTTMRRLANGMKPDYDSTGAAAVLRMWL